MQLEIKQVTFPEVIEFNFEELKQELQNKMVRYQNIVYTDEQVQEAKKDVASLRKFASALSDERIRVKKQCLQPYEAFEEKIKELSTIVNGPIELIATQLKAFEERQKEEKLEEIKAYWESKEAPNEIKFDLLFDAKWLNASVKMSTISKEIDERLSKIDSDLSVIEDLPYFAFEAKEAYYSHLDLGKAIGEAHRLQAQAEKKAAWEAEQAKRKAEAEAKETKPSEPIKEAPKTICEEPKKTWLGFKALLSIEDATALRNFFDERKIEFHAI